MCRIRVIFHKADAVAAENAKTGNLRKSDHGGIDPPHGREVERYEASSAVKPSSSSTGKGRPPGSGLGCGQARAATTKAPRPVALLSSSQMWSSEPKAERGTK
mmetsp:Transcript_8775/g.26602  ORF Transcript_8775/g.26602 Transcript_8775/m.26602 type:complete len:103 (+) Transcript_8775:1130-1438(+)